jgi:thioredoxin reductase/bacterioferritin-associated ferredoxin
MSALLDAVIVGAGPAGMGAALQMSQLGLHTLVIDEQTAPGGQIWRAVEVRSARPDGMKLGSAYLAGMDVARRFRASGIAYRPGAQFWHAEPLESGGMQIFTTSGNCTEMVRAARLLLATGAQERPVPFPGWTLPGVVTVGGAQILLKTSGQVPCDPIWIAGCGPLPLLYMTQLLDHGIKVAGFLDTAPRGNRRAARPHLMAALRVPDQLLKGASWLARLHGAGVRIVKDVEHVEARGSDRLEEVRYRTGTGSTGVVRTSTLLVHEGVVPAAHAAMALGCAHDWHEQQLCFTPRQDRWHETSVPGIHVAGDGAGIGGAEAAGLSGRIAAIGVALGQRRLSPSEAERLAKPLRAGLTKALAIRPFLDARFRPRQAVLTPADDVAICRCEGVTAAQVRAATRVGVSGPNQVKVFTRCGMGPCQARQCGATLINLIAAERACSPVEIGFLNIRPPLKPVTVGELAALSAVAP